MFNLRSGLLSQLRLTKCNQYTVHSMTILTFWWCFKNLAGFHLTDYGCNYSMPKFLRQTFSGQKVSDRAFSGASTDAKYSFTSSDILVAVDFISPVSVYANYCDIGITLYVCKKGLLAFLMLQDSFISNIQMAFLTF